MLLRLGNFDICIYFVFLLCEICEHIVDGSSLECLRVRCSRDRSVNTLGHRVKQSIPGAIRAATIFRRGNKSAADAVSLGGCDENS